MQKLTNDKFKMQKKIVNVTRLKKFILFEMIKKTACTVDCIHLRLISKH